MTPIILSIGLNVGASEPATQLSATLRAAEAIFGPLRAVAMGRGEWGGVPERFVQVAVAAYPRAIPGAARQLATALHQDAIAVTTPAPAPAAHWILYASDGAVSPGGTAAEFPIIVNP